MLVLAFIVWLFSKDVELAITILVLGCPGALVIGVPVSHVAGIGNGARHGILLKGSEVISDFSRVDTFVFDKTGTLTVGEPEVAYKEYYGEEVDRALSYLASIERESDHPLAKAVLEEIGETQLYPVENTQVVKGGGIIADVDGHSVIVGNMSLMEREQVELDSKMRLRVAELEQSGHSLVLTAVDRQLKVVMGVRDQVREGVKEDLRKLKTRREAFGHALRRQPGYCRCSE